MAGEENQSIEREGIHSYQMVEQAQGDDLISIIVPVYNVSGFLKNCVESLINQTWPHVEILLIDDGSTDDSGAIADEYAARDPRVRVFHKPNGGVSSARNVGLREATGKYITFVDSDDWIRRDTCELVMRAMQSTGANVCFFNITMAPVRAANYLRAPKAPGGACGQYELVQQVLRHYYPCINNKCFHRDVLFREDGSLIEFDQDTRILEDGLWLMQTAPAWKRGVLLRTGLSFRRLWSGSAMGDKSKELQTKLEFMQTFRRLIPMFAAFGEEMENEAREYFMTFSLAAVKKATWRSNRQWLKAYAEEMKQVDENYAVYIYADLYNALARVSKAPSPAVMDYGEEADRRWNGRLAKGIKRLMPQKLKDGIKAILRRLKLLK